MTTHYVVDITTDTRVTPDVLDQIIADLEPWHAAAGESLQRTLSITLTLPADSLAQAVATALRVTGEHGSPISVTAEPEALRDQREGFAPIPDLLSVTEAAEALGVTRQRVLQMIDAGKVPAVRVGNAWAIPAGAVSGDRDD